MIYKQCNYYILLLLYDFEWENVEIKQTWNLKLEDILFVPNATSMQEKSIIQLDPQNSPLTHFKLLILH